MLTRHHLTDEQVETLCGLWDADLATIGAVTVNGVSRPSPPEFRVCRVLPVPIPSWLDHLHTLNLVEYRVGGYIDWHQDKTPDRRDTYVYGLSSDYEGGELEVTERMRLEAGDMARFPAGARHRVHPVTSGVRLVGVGWDG